MRKREGDLGAWNSCERRSYLGGSRGEKEENSKKGPERKRLSDRGAGIAGGNMLENGKESKGGVAWGILKKAETTKGVYCEKYLKHILEREVRQARWNNTLRRENGVRRRIPGQKGFLVGSP